MSMPQYFVVAVVAYEDQSTAATVTALLGGPGNQGIAPHIVPVCVLPKALNTINLIQAGHRHLLTIAQCIRLFLLDPRLVDLWLCLDRTAEAEVRQHLQTHGPAPQDYYRYEFPDPVVYCGFSIPAFPDSHDKYEAWFTNLKSLFAPWKERIHQAFSNSS